MRDYLYAFALFLAVTLVTTLGTMQVMLNRQGEGTPVPEIVGLRVTDAIDRLDRLGLTLTVTGLDYSPTVNAEGVMTQSPTAGEKLLPGEGVAVTVSRGSRTVVLPDLSSLPLAQARSILATNRLKSPELLRIPSEQAPETVLAQTPPPGRVVTRDEKVSLLVSSGPAPAHVMTPDFSGMSLSAVMNRIKEIDLRVARVSYAPNDRVDKGIVLAQEPPFGQRMKAGSFVTLTVSEGAETTAGEGAFTFLYYTLPDGPQAKRVTLSQENDNGTKEIYNRVHRPGDTFSILVSLAGETTVKIFLDHELADVRRFSPPR